jgi:hypothetical protein
MYVAFMPLYYLFCIDVVLLVLFLLNRIVQNLKICFVFKPAQLARPQAPHQSD